MYCAVIGDLVASKKMEAEERRALQERLRLLLERVNNDYADYIAANFLITLGDEFQGLLIASWPAVEIIELITRELCPQKIRFGVGLGDIFTQIDARQALGADGPAFHLARAAIDELKATKESALNFYPVRYQTQHADEGILSALCVAVSVLMSRWTANQRECVFMADHFAGQQKFVAVELGRDRSTVARGLKAAQYKQYRFLLDSMKKYLRRQYDIPCDEADCEKAKSFYNAGLYEEKNYRYDDAITDFEKALKFSDEEFLRSGKIYRKIADACREKGEYQKALPFYQKALALQNEAESASVETCAVYVNMAVIYERTEEFEKAFQALEKALGISVNLFGKEHPNTAIVYDSMGNVYEAQGNFDEALRYLKLALTIREKTLGCEHPETASSYNNIGVTYNHQADYAAALAYFEKSYSIYQKVFEKDHPDTAYALNNIGEAYCRQGELEKARGCLEKAAGILEKKMGPFHPYTKAVFSNLEELYLKTGDLEKALEYRRKTADAK